MTTAEVAAAMGICEQRVRQLEASAIRKLREFTALREHVQ
jgi:DNA-directed RNA polymerase sigma subunit (sigma70/sigma32)